LDGNKIRIDSTPTYFINGKRFVGALPIAELKKILEADN
jgi:protein-disulfide isomerase